jgi:hypothetical protein
MGVGDFFEAFLQYSQEEAIAKITWEAFFLVPPLRRWNAYTIIELS